MTRSYFEEEVTNWSDLIEFGSEESCSITDEIYTESDKDDYFNDRVVDMARDCSSWYDLYQMLEDIPDGYEYYLRDDYNEFRAADWDDFDDMKSRVLEWGDNNEVWDEEDEDDPTYEFNFPEDELSEEDQCVDEEDFSVSELFSICNCKLASISLPPENNDIFDDPIIMF